MDLFLFLFIIQFLVTLDARIIRLNLYSKSGMASQLQTNTSHPHSPMNSMHQPMMPHPLALPLAVPPPTMGYQHPNAIGSGYPPHFNPADRCVTGGSGSSVAMAYSGVVRFNRIGIGSRLRSIYIAKVIRAQRQEDCEKACSEARDFTCRSFNYRSFFQAENCELSIYDTKQLKMDNSGHFEQHTQFDYYERDLMSGTPASNPVG